MNQASRFDVVILGGGPAGCATALALARLEVAHILVVEAGQYDVRRVGECVPPDVRVPLERLGIWADFQAEGHEPCLGSCASWGSEALGYNDFLFNALGNGWHLDRRRFDALLARKALERGVHVITGRQFAGCERIANRRFLLRIVGDDGHAELIAARFVVDATGLRSCFARHLGIGKVFTDRLLCAVALFEYPAGSRFSKLSMLEAVEYGWWYAGQLPDRRLIVAVATDPEILRRDELRKRDVWRERLADAKHISASMAGSSFVENSFAICAAPSFLLDQVAGDDWLAVGDAAAAYDPISSQGIHKALSDGISAGRAIATAINGSRIALSEYQSSVASQFQKFLKGRRHFYGLERRWPRSLFWERRQARSFTHL